MMNRLVAAIRGHFNNAPGPFRTIDYASYHEKTSPDALPDSRALRLSCDAMERDVWGRAGDGVRCTGPPLPHGGWATPSPRTTIKTDHSSGARDSALHGNIELTNGARLLDTFLNEGTVSSGMVRDSTMGHVQLVDALVISSELCAISMVIGAYVRNSILVNSIVCCGAKVSGCRLINTRVCGGELKECKKHGGCLVLSGVTCGDTTAREASTRRSTGIGAARPVPSPRTRRSRSFAICRRAAEPDCRRK